MHSFGRKGVRPIDRLVVYYKTLEPNGIRAKIYDHEVRVARRQERLPQEAQAVYEEIIEKQKRRIKEIFIIYIKLILLTTNSKKFISPIEKLKMFRMLALIALTILKRRRTKF